MTEIVSIAGLSQGGLNGLAGIGELGAGPASTAGRPSAQSPLYELASLMAEALLNDESGQASGKSGHANAGQSLLQQLQGGDKQRGGAGSDSKELLTQVLLALFEKILSGENGSTGSAPPGGAGQHVQGGLGATQGAGARIEELANTLFKTLGEDSLGKSISPADDGAGQVAQNKSLKELLELIAQFMDSHPETFGQPTGRDNAANAPKGSGAPIGSTLASAPTASAAPDAPPSTGVPASPAAPTLANTAGPGVSSVAFATPSSNPTVVNQTIKVGSGEVFDGKGQTFTAGSTLGDGSQREGQKPIFELAEGATLKNVVFGDNGADGVHVKASGGAMVNIDNVHWSDVGEDALTVKDGGAKTTNLSITNSSAQGASDKIFQLNADANVKVDGFKARDFGTFIRTNGGQQGNWNLELSNISAENGKFSFVKSDSEGLNLKTHNIELVNVKNAYSKLPESTNRQEV